MKITIQIAIIAIVLVTMFWIGFEKTVNSRCSYYQRMGIKDVQLCDK